MTTPKLSLPERLARERVTVTFAKRLVIRIDDALHQIGETYASREGAEDNAEVLRAGLAEAIRAALDEAARVARETAGDSGEVSAQARSHRIAALIERLKGDA
jgi:hypothetical protein